MENGRLIAALENALEALRPELCPHCGREALYFDSDGTYEGEVRIYRENVAEYIGKEATCDRCETETTIGKEGS